MLIRLIYASTVREGVDLNELKRILQQSQANNQRRDLTGILAFNSKIVLQALEGSREEVNSLYAKLLRDDRHHTVTMLKYQEVQERQWASWSMGFAAPGADNRAVFLKYSPQSSFNPYAMPGDAVEKMLLELAGKTIAMTVPDSAMPKPVAVQAAPQATAAAAAAAAASAPVAPAVTQAAAAPATPRPIVARPPVAAPAQPAAPLQPSRPAAAAAAVGAAAARPVAAARPAADPSLIARFLGR